MSASNRDLAKEFLSTGSGKLGAGLFIMLLAISVFVIATYPLDFGTKIWSSPKVWEDNPKAVPPVWINAFDDFSRAEHRVFELTEPSSTRVIGGGKELIYSFGFDYSADEFPSFLSLTINEVRYFQDPPLVTLSMVRPDSTEVIIYREIVTGPRQEEVVPIIRYKDSPKRVNLGGASLVESNVARFLEDILMRDVSTLDVAGKIEEILLGSIAAGEQLESLEVLKGEYVIQVRFVTFDQRDTTEGVKFVLGGSVFGLMGTDIIGRDLMVGLLYGFPVALGIGIITAVVTTIIGTFGGIVSGYVGGKTDTVLQRTSDILSNIPLLPLLIFLIFVLGPRLWLVVVVLIIFGWPGLTIVVRSMVLPLRSGQSVEAARALGASRSRIMTKHLFPQIAPFVFAQMVFTVPGAILAEAGLSFLGLGDPSIPTWGQLLQSGFTSGAVYIGLWWWVLPPGLLIVLTAMIFVFIALGVEPVVNPRLRRVA